MLLVEKNVEQLPPNDNVIGVDLGIKTLVVDSDGKEYENIKYNYGRNARK